MHTELLLRVSAEVTQVGAVPIRNSREPCGACALSTTTTTTTTSSFSFSSSFFFFCLTSSLYALTSSSSSFIFYLHFYQCYYYDCYFSVFFLRSWAKTNGSRARFKHWIPPLLRLRFLFLLLLLLGLVTSRPTCDINTVLCRCVSGSIHPELKPLPSPRFRKQNQVQFISGQVSLRSNLRETHSNRIIWKAESIQSRLNGLDCLVDSEITTRCK